PCRASTEASTSTATPLSSHDQSHRQRTERYPAAAAALVSVGPVADGVNARVAVVAVSIKAAQWWSQSRRRAPEPGNGASLSSPWPESNSSGHLCYVQVQIGWPLTDSCPGPGVKTKQG